MVSDFSSISSIFCCQPVHLTLYTYENVDIQIFLFLRYQNQNSNIKLSIAWGFDLTTFHGFTVYSLCYSMEPFQININFVHGNYYAFHRVEFALTCCYFYCTLTCACFVLYLYFQAYSAVPCSSTWFVIYFLECGFLFTLNFLRGMTALQMW